MKRDGSFEAATLKALKPLARPAGWRIAQGWPFRQHGDWFVAARPSIRPDGTSFEIRLEAKPMAIDPILWELIGCPENAEESLSFRLFGVWTCAMVEIDRAELAINGQAPAEVAEAIMQSCNARFEAHIPGLDNRTFLRYLANNRPRGYGPTLLVTQVLTLTIAGRPDEAVELCRQARMQHDNCLMSVKGVGFPELFLTWQSRRARAGF